jgi:UDP-N-acetylmuramoylalanine--D-glutamate ligase
MARAVDAAADLAASVLPKGKDPRGTVLLAPACASMDLFAWYGERGDVFARLVREKKAREHGAAPEGTGLDGTGRG